MLRLSPATAGMTPSSSGPARPRLASRIRVATAFLLPAALAVAAFTAPARATPVTSTNVEFGIYPHTSDGGQDPFQTNPPNTPYVYTFTVHSGDAFSDTIHFHVCLDSVTTGSLTTWSDQVAIKNITGDFSADVTPSGSPWSFDESSPVEAVDGSHDGSDPACQAGSLAISIPTGNLTTVGNNLYTTNITFQTQNNSNPSTPPKLVDTFDTVVQIQLQFNVLPAESSSRITCFMTDGEGNLLTDCNGDEVTQSGAQDGVFAIVTKKNGLAVSTNPGQLYYNLLWRNDTGSSQTVNVSMDLTGLVAHGAQAVHWLVFPTSGGAATFDDVIMGNPAGATGDISNISVPAGDTLYVTYHLEWDGIGEPADCGTCGDQANTQVSVEGSVSGSFTNSPDMCTSGALGYNKN